MRLNPEHEKKIYQYACGNILLHDECVTIYRSLMETEGVPPEHRAELRAIPEILFMNQVVYPTDPGLRYTYRLQVINRKR